MVYLDVANNHIMREHGTFSHGITLPRLQTVSGSQYAYSPCTVAGLPDARLLQAMTLTLLEAGEIGGPVQSPAGWHLVRVLDQREALHTDIHDEQTIKKTRRMYLDEKLNQYVISLRKQDHPVEINEEMIGKLSQQEIDWYQEMLGKAQKSPEEVIEEIRKLQR